MYSTSTLRREDDGKLFRVTFLSHWSDIQAEDGEKDAVKWLWENTYISFDGKKYTVFETM